MQQISPEDINARIRRDNPWWGVGMASFHPDAQLPKRVYFEPFKRLALNYGVRRAAVLLGPRRVGKTVMLKQIIRDAVEGGG